MSVKKDFRFYIIMLITLFFMFGFGYLPTFSEITPAGMRVLGIFLGCVFAWCFGEIIWPSVLGLVCLTLYDFGTIDSNFASTYGNGTAAMLLVAIIFCFAIERSGLLNELAMWITGQKWAQKSIWSLVLAFYLAAILIGAIATNIVPPIVLLWALFYEVAKEIGIKPYDKIAIIILLGIGVVGFVGCIIMPYNIMTVAVIGAAEAYNPSFVYDVKSHLLLCLIVAAIYVPLLVFILKLLLGKHIKFKMPVKDAYRIHLTRSMKWTLVYLLLLVAMMIVPNFLTEENVFRVIFGNKLGILGCLMLLTVLMALTKVEGKPILDIAESLSNVPWPMFLIVSTSLGISGYLTADEMGIVQTMIKIFEPLISGHSALTITLIFLVIGLVLTNCINDIVTAVVLYPIAASFIIDAGGSIMLFTILFGQATFQGCFLPSASVAGAMFHGNTQWMKAKDVFFYITIMEIILLAVLIFVTGLGHLMGI